jgi:RNA polymerase sigma-70 factor, ECF subfamily
MVENNENKLIIACKNKDHQAFAELLNRYRRPLFSYLLRLCQDQSAAEDLFQETTIKVWKGMDAFDPRYKFGSWLFSIAYRTSIDALRQKKRRSIFRQLEALPEISHNHDPLEELTALETKALFKKAVGSLSEKQRQVFLMRQHGELSFKEISEVMNEPLNTVLSHMHYAVTKIKTLLRENHAIE